MSPFRFRLAGGFPIVADHPVDDAVCLPTPAYPGAVRSYRRGQFSEQSNEGLR